MLRPVSVSRHRRKEANIRYPRLQSLGDNFFISRYIKHNFFTIYKVLISFFFKKLQVPFSAGPYTDYEDAIQNLLIEPLDKDF